MHRRRTRIATVAATFCAILTVLVTAAACDDGAIPQACSGIPLGGCPIARGVSCQDPTCEAIYACRPNNTWEFLRPCPAREAGPPRDEDAGSDAARSFDASIDAPPGAYGGPGCEDLQTPECSLGLALTCGPGCCGCEDLFVCTTGGWDLWGTCVDGEPTQH